MNVSLTPELERLVQSQVESGRYHSPSEVVREALHLLEEREDLRRTALKELRSRIDQGIAELDRAEGVNGEDFMAAIIDGLDARETQRKTG